MTRIHGGPLLGGRAANKQPRKMRGNKIVLPSSEAQEWQQELEEQRAENDHLKGREENHAELPRGREKLLKGLLLDTDRERDT